MGLLGSIKTAILGGKKKTNSANSAQDVDPYAPAIPYINDYLAKVGGMFNGGQPLFSGTEEDAIRTLLDEAYNQEGAIRSAITENNKTASGQYLTPDTNPYLRDIATRVSGIAGANQNATFGGRGRSGSGLAGYYSGKGVADSLTDLYGTTYENERSRQEQAVGMAPQLEAGRFLPAQALLSAGQNISARPFDVAAQYGDILGKIGSLGQQSTGTQQNYKQSGGLIGKIANSFTNKLFG